MKHKGSKWCRRENGLTAAMVSLLTGTQLLGGCNPVRYGRRARPARNKVGVCGLASRKRCEVAPPKTPQSSLLQNRIYIFIMDLYAE